MIEDRSNFDSVKESEATLSLTPRKLKYFLFSFLFHLMFFSRGRCLHRQKHFLILALIVTLVFLMYQLFSVGQLGKELSRRKPKSKLQTNFKSYEKADGFMPVRYADDEKKEMGSLNDYKSLSENIKHMPGVLPPNRKFYVPSAKKTFKCIHSGEEINFSMVNDNFCDCSDFSDEPSTSACNFGRFHCSYQSKNGPNDIVSYKVNDGICDCCDGSDEWDHAILPIHTLVSASEQKGIYQIPCSYRCH